MGIAIGPIGPASAEFSQYPFCLQGRDYPGWSGCSYHTLQAPDPLGAAGSSRANHDRAAALDREGYGVCAKKAR